MKSRMFDMDHAVKYGVNEAIFINLLQFWITQNRANKQATHFHDGRYWTFNSLSAWSAALECFSERQIRTIVKSLVDQNIIIRGNYHETKKDCSHWYAFVDEEEFLGPILGGEGVTKKSGGVTKKSGGVTKVSLSPTLESERNTERNTSTPPSLQEVAHTSDLIPLLNEWLIWCKDKAPHLKLNREACLTGLEKVQKHLSADYESLRTILKFIQQDEFWKDKAYSPVGLMQTSKNGLKKIDNIVTKLKSSSSYKTTLMQEHFKKLPSIEEIAW